MRSPSLWYLCRLCSLLIFFGGLRHKTRKNNGLALTHTHTHTNTRDQTALPAVSFCCCRFWVSDFLFVLLRDAGTKKLRAPLQKCACCCCVVFKSKYQSTAFLRRKPSLREVVFILLFLVALSFLPPLVARPPRVTHEIYTQFFHCFQTLGRIAVGHLARRSLVLRVP